MSSNRQETRQALAAKQEQLNLQPGAGAADLNIKSNTKPTGGSFAARLNAAPPLVVATDSDSGEEPPTEYDDDEVPPAAVARSNPAADLTSFTAAAPSVDEQLAARPSHLSLSAAPRPASPSHISNAMSTAAINRSPSHAAALPAAPLVQHPSSDSDALSYVDIDSDYVAEASKPTQSAALDSAQKDGGQPTSRKKAGKKGPWWSAEGLSPKKGSSSRYSTVRGKEATFTFYEDAPLPTVFGQPAQRTSPRSHPPASRTQPRPSPLRLEQEDEAQRRSRRTPKKNALSNEEVTRRPDPKALLESFRTAAEAIKARPRAAPRVRSAEGAASEVHEEGEGRAQDMVDLSTEGEEDLPNPAELKVAPAPIDDDRKDQGAATAKGNSPSAATNSKSKSRRPKQPASDPQPDDFDTPPHLAASARPRRQTRISTASAKAIRSFDSTTPPSSDTEAEELPKNKRRGKGKGKAVARGKPKATKKRDTPPLDTEALLSMLPKRKRKVETELTDSGEEPEDEEVELASDVDEIGYRAKKKRSTTSKAKGPTSTRAKTSNSSKNKKAKTTGRGKKAAVKKEEEEEPDSEKERAKQKRLAQLKDIDDYELEVMTVL